MTWLQQAWTCKATVIAAFHTNRGPLRSLVPTQKTQQQQQQQRHHQPDMISSRMSLWHRPSLRSDRRQFFPSTKKNTILLAIAKGTVLITGATDGIGFVTAQHLALQGYAVLIHGRNETKIAHTVQQVDDFVNERKVRSAVHAPVIALPPAHLNTVAGCQGLVESVLALWKNKRDNSGDKDDGPATTNLPPLSVVLNNAGVFSDARIVTSDGLDQCFAVHVLAPFVLCSLLLPHLWQAASSSSTSSTSSKASRLVLVTSVAQFETPRDVDWSRLPYPDDDDDDDGYDGYSTYAATKAANAMLSVEMAHRLQSVLDPEATRITCNCLDPGTVNTNMLLDGWGPCGIDVQDALDETWICSSREVDEFTGQYFSDRIPRMACKSVHDHEQRDQLWKVVTELAPPEAVQVWNFDWFKPE